MSDRNDEPMYIWFESRIMNEDIVLHIMDYLSIEELYQMRAVSKQMKFCANYSLRRRKCVRFGQTNDAKHCRQPNHWTQESIDWSDKVYSPKVSNIFIKTLVSKCVNICCVYLNIEIDIQVVEWMAGQWPRLQCLCLGYKFFTDFSTQLLLIGRLFAENITHLSIECYFKEDFDENVGQLLSQLKKLRRLRVIHFRPLKNALDYVCNDLQSLEINCSPFWFSDAFGDSDIRALQALIRRNGRQMRCLYIADYHISESVLLLICQHLDLHELSISCQSLSLSCVVKHLSKYQRNLRLLVLNGLVPESQLLECGNSHLDIKYLSLNSCHIEVKVFREFLDRCPALKTFEFNGLYFKCRCNPVVAGEPDLYSQFYCQICDQKCFVHLSAVKSLKSLQMNSVWTHISDLWPLLPDFKSMTKLRIPAIDRNNCRLLAAEVPKLTARLPNKYYTIKFNKLDTKQTFVDEMNQMPKNLKLVVK